MKSKKNPKMARRAGCWYDVNVKIVIISETSASIGTKCPVAFLNLAFVETVEVIKKAPVLHR